MKLSYFTNKAYYIFFKVPWIDIYIKIDKHLRDTYTCFNVIVLKFTLPLSDLDKIHKLIERKTPYYKTILLQNVLSA